MKKILIALDYEPSAQMIANAGYNIAKAMNAETILLHVIPESSFYSSLKYSAILGFDSLSTVNMVDRESMTDLTNAAEGFLQTIKQKIGDGSINTAVRNGDLSGIILEAARDIKADMIVIGTHHRKGIDKMLLGSVAEKVFRHSQIPILIIPVTIVE